MLLVEKYMDILYRALHVVPGFATENIKSHIMGNFTLVGFGRIPRLYCVFKEKIEYQKKAHKNND